jgi:hypothetical protein
MTLRSSDLLCGQVRGHQAPFWLLAITTPVVVVMLSTGPRCTGRPALDAAGTWRP